jgi:endonuclease-3
VSFFDAFETTSPRIRSPTPRCSSSPSAGTNRWGIVSTRFPEQTMLALEGILPRRYWIEINRLLVPFGKHVCTGRLPKCSTCPVLEYCRQVGVTTRR